MSDFFGSISTPVGMTITNKTIHKKIDAIPTPATANPITPLNKINDKATSATPNQSSNYPQQQYIRVK